MRKGRTVLTDAAGTARIRFTHNLFQKASDVATGRWFIGALRHQMIRGSVEYFIPSEKSVRQGTGPAGAFIHAPSGSEPLSIHPHGATTPFDGVHLYKARIDRAPGTPDNVFELGDAVTITIEGRP